jgi:hypothetical protein
MAVTPYFTLQELKDFMGFSARDMKTAGVQMTESEYGQFVSDYEPRVAQMVHRYCNVVDFRPTIVTELKNGRGASNDDTARSDYLESDVSYYLRNLYFTDGTHDPILVYEDLGSPTGAESWTARTLRTALTGGDYRVITDNELTEIRFHANIPRQGYGNVKMTYYTGYASTSAQFQDIKLQVLRCAKNLIMMKKKVQEATTARNFGVRDFSTMFEPFDESSVLSGTEKEALERYRRYPLDGPMFW